jgi:hypothetical protein
MKKSEKIRVSIKPAEHPPSQERLGEIAERLFEILARARRRRQQSKATAITQMLHIGRFWSVKLACGCTRTLTSPDLKREQLYIGKAVACPNHGATHE